ncbi:MAG: radical SAM domain-containing protein [Promethearchaeota archaeon CR_4]|nr:MAG: radical SAM domain-containing protein [Candidatus Lokiarchaeota archaeon CR_4]
MQLGRELLVNRDKRFASFTFSPAGILESFHLTSHEIRDIFQTGSTFETRGCPQCNRPYYDSRPGGTIYNYATPLSHQQKMEVQKLLQPFV